MFVTSKRNLTKYEKRPAMSNTFIRLAAAMAFVMATPFFAGGSVVIYPETPLPHAKEFSVKADGCDIGVYNAGTFRCAPFAFSGEVTVEVTYRLGDIRSFQINPLSKSIVAHQNGNTLTFKLTRPEKLEIQINGATSQIVDGNKLLYLFADAPEANPPAPDDKTVIYFGPGLHNLPDGVLKVDNTDTHSALYLAPGAVLNAAVDIKRSKPFTLYGRGFIRNPFKTKDHMAIRFSNCKNVVVKDVVFFDSISHGICFFGGSDNLVKNVKALHYIVNSDGITFHDSCARCRVEDCFIVGNDNLIVIGGGRGQQGATENIVQGCTFIKSSYAGNWGFPQGDGPIGSGNVINDCDVIRCNGEVGLVRMFWAKPTTMANLVFQNIRVQSFAGYQPNPQKTNLNRFLSLESDGVGYAREMTFKDIYLPSEQTSFIAPGKWTIIFDHVYVANKAATSDADLKLTKGAGVVTKYIY